jgi:hypothetical protein
MNYDKKFPVNERGSIIRTAKRLTIQDGIEKYSISVSGGRPAEIKDDVYDKLAELNSFIASLF